MQADGRAEAFRVKAEESLASATSEFANRRYNSCANRCYYACFQAAIVALLRERIQPPRSDQRWGHAFVQAQFAGQLIIRRKLYPSSLRDVLPRLLALRQHADYELDPVGRVQAGRALGRTREFVEAIIDRGDT